MTSINVLAMGISLFSFIVLSKNPMIEVQDG